MTGRPALISRRAGARRERDYLEIAHMGGRRGHEGAAGRGRVGVDVAVEATVLLEDSGLYVAGRGLPNLPGPGADASLMDGATRPGRSPPCRASASGRGRPRCHGTHLHVMLAEEGVACSPSTRGWSGSATRPPGSPSRTGRDNHPPGTLAHGTVGVACWTATAGWRRPRPPACSARCPVGDTSSRVPVAGPTGRVAVSTGRASISSASPPACRSAGASARARPWPRRGAR
jgi:hypothetical protein